MTDQDTLKEIEARLRGRTAITRQDDKFGHLRVERADGRFNTFHGTLHGWPKALAWAREVPGVIFGPPGYDTEL